MICQINCIYHNKFPPICAQCIVILTSITIPASFIITPATFIQTTQLLLQSEKSYKRGILQLWYSFLIKICCSPIAVYDLKYEFHIPRLEHIFIFKMYPQGKQALSPQCSVQSVEWLILRKYCNFSHFLRILLQLWISALILRDYDQSILRVRYLALVGFIWLFYHNASSTFRCCVS